MADGYARISNKVSVVTAQNGPAATLLVPPLAEALKASIPVVALVQEVPRAQADKNAFQEFDHIRLVRESVAKWVRRVDRPDRIDDYVDMAFTVAASRPARAGGAAAVPADVLSSPSDRRAVAGRRSSACSRSTAASADPRPCRRGRRPAGPGPRAADRRGRRRPSFGRDCRARRPPGTCSLPVATTVDGQGAVDETHPLSLGVVGYFMGARQPHTGHAPARRRTPTWSCWSAPAPTRTAPTAGRCSRPTRTLIHLDIDGAGDRAQLRGAAAGRRRAHGYRWTSSAALRAAGYARG